MSALAVIPIQPPAPTLYDLEANLLALLDTADLVGEEQRQEFEVELQQALTTTIAKRDRANQFLAHCESQIALADAEIARLKARKDSFARASGMMERIIIRIIQDRGAVQTQKGLKFHPLEGSVVTFNLRKNPDSVEITDEALVPQQFKRITVQMPAPAFDQFLDLLDLEQRADILAQITSTKFEVQKTPIKAAIAAGQEVPGAHIVQDSYNLRRD